MIFLFKYFKFLDRFFVINIAEWIPYDKQFYKHDVESKQGVIKHKIAVSYIYIGILYDKKGVTDKAIENYIKAISSDKKIPATYDKLGKLFFKQGDYKKAIKCYEVLRNMFEIKMCFKSWLGSDPLNPKIMLRRAKYLKSIGMFEKSISCYQNVASLSKDNQLRIQALNNVTDILKDKTELALIFRSLAVTSGNEYYDFAKVDEVNFIEKLRLSYRRSGPRQLS